MDRGIMRPETFELVEQSIEESAEAIKVVVLYHGGEPLLHRDFAQLVRRVKSQGVAFVKTVTNGMLLDERRVEDIIGCGLDAVEISLDGRSPAENDLIRRGCDFRTVADNVKRLVAARDRAGSSTPLIYIASTQFLDQGSHQRRDQEPEVPEFLHREFSSGHVDPIAGYKCTYAMRWPHMRVADDMYEVFHDRNDVESRNYCDHVESTMTVRWNGDVVACCYDLTSQCVLGNVHAAGLSAIWNGERALRLRDSIARQDFMALCASCSVVRPNAYLRINPEYAVSNT